MELDDEFELAVAALAGGGEPEGGPLEDDGGWEVAAAILEGGGPVERQGFGRHSRAATAYARKCLEAKRSKSKIQELEGAVAEIKSRRFKVTLGSILFFGRSLVCEIGWHCRAARVAVFS